MIPRRGRPRVDHQAVFPFLARSRRLDAIFRRLIAAISLGAIVAIVASSAPLRARLATSADRAWAWSRSRAGMELQRDEIEAANLRLRRRSEATTRATLDRFYRGTTPETRRYFDAASMDPAHGLIASGLPDLGFLLSSAVYRGAEGHEGYRLRPGVRSIWLRQVTLKDAPFTLLIVPDTREVRSAAAAIGGIVVETSAQTTNSWGYRGAEFDPDAAVRGIVLGDSFMQGTLVGDEDAPPNQLRRALERRNVGPVSILNTGHIGYSPEQYYGNLTAVGARVRPHFVVVSVCSNDFGDGRDVLSGGGDAWEESAYWLGEIAQWCRSRMIPLLVVSIPADEHVTNRRREANYPGRVSEVLNVHPSWLADPLDAFVEENQRRILDRRSRGQGGGPSELYNLQLADGHLSPAGSALWAEFVARRLDALIRWSEVAPGGGATSGRPGG